MNLEEHEQSFKQLMIDLYKLKEEPKVMISRSDYEVFCKEYVFYKLKGDKFGSAFCKRFDISDRAISSLVDEQFTKDLIEVLGYIK